MTDNKDLIQLGAAVVNDGQECLGHCKMLLSNNIQHRQLEERDWIVLDYYSLYYKATFVPHLSKRYVLYTGSPETKRPPLAVSLLARQECRRALVTVAPGRQRITGDFIGGKLTIGGKPSVCGFRKARRVVSQVSRGRGGRASQQLTVKEKLSVSTRR